MAERLLYGPAPTPLTELDAAFLDTSVGSELHDQWTQVGVDGTGTLYEITWQFSDTKSVADRFQNAIDNGEAVVWTVNSPLLASVDSPQVLAGTWRFSSGAGDLLSRFDGTSVEPFFVSDVGPSSPGNGIWGAGTGQIDGTTSAAPVPVTNWKWGLGNLNGTDFAPAFVVPGLAVSATLMLDGQVTPIPAGFKNLMYVETTAVPEPSSFVLLAAVILMTCGIRHYRCTT